MPDSITVIDLGGQYAHLIASKFRSLGYHAVIADPEAPLEELAKSAGIVLSGSPSLSAYDEDNSSVRKILDLPVPILGFLLWPPGNCQALRRNRHPRPARIWPRRAHHHG